MEDRLGNMEEYPEPLEESHEDSQEYDRVMDENHRQMQELLDRAADLLAPIREERAPTEKPC